MSCRSATRQAPETGPHLVLHQKPCATTTFVSNARDTPEMQMTDKLTNAPTCSDTPESCAVTRSDTRVSEAPTRLAARPRRRTIRPTSRGRMAHPLSAQRAGLPGHQPGTTAPPHQARDLRPAGSASTASSRGGGQRATGQNYTESKARQQIRWHKLGFR